MNYDKLIDDIFWENGKLINAHKRSKQLSIHPNICSYIKNRYNDSDDLKENLFRIHYHIDVRPVCEYCGRRTLFVGRLNLTYQRFCSNSCAGKGTERGKQWFENQKKNNKEKYGIENNFDLPWLKKERMRVKIRQTWLRKFGVECNLVSQENIDKMIESKRRNHTFNTSKPEEELYLYIKEKFPDVERQYKDKERYPFCCDFYIPSIDLFLELNAMWTHGAHPYNEQKDKDKLNEWKIKAKTSKFYECAINTWTKSDIKKRNIAKQNNLNFKEAYTLEEGKKIIDSIYTNTKKEHS